MHNVPVGSKNKLVSKILIGNFLCNFWNFNFYNGIHSLQDEAGCCLSRRHGRTSSNVRTLLISCYHARSCHSARDAEITNFRCTIITENVSFLLHHPSRMTWICDHKLVVKFGNRHKSTLTVKIYDIGHVIWPQFLVFGNIEFSILIGCRWVAAENKDWWCFNTVPQTIRAKFRLPISHRLSD